MTFVAPLVAVRAIIAGKWLDRLCVYLLKGETLVVQPTPGYVGTSHDLFLATAVLRQRGMVVERLELDARFTCLLVHCATAERPRALLPPSSQRLPAIDFRLSAGSAADSTATVRLLSIPERLQELLSTEGL